VSAEPETGLVISLNHDGDGVVHAGKAAFVGGALPGETVSFVRRKRHRQHDEAELREVLVASPLRVVPACPHFGVCGGCALQHLSPESQLEIKQQQLCDDLLRIGKVVPQQWLAPVTGPVWRYRRRARLGARYVFKRERSLVGFRERQGSFIAAIDQCEVLAEPVNQLIAPLSQLLTSLSIRERLPQIEVAVADTAVALVLRVLDPPSPEDLQRMLDFEQAHAVRIYLQPKGLNTVRPLREPAPTLLYGLPEFDLQMEFLPTDFVQINAGVNQALITRVLELLQLDGDSRVLDLFCGLGNFSLPLARHAASVTGIEGDAGLVARATANAARNGIGNANFITADLSVVPAPGAAWLAGGYSHVLLDPPRAGAREILAAIAALAPRRLAYVSCHPGSLARDLGILVHEHGYELLAAGVADMFPHTAHVESIALLQLRTTKAKRSAKLADNGGYP
jgi:23S rRNA (uracil1939-C5)-methyltransferase